MTRLRSLGSEMKQRIRNVRSMDSSNNDSNTSLSEMNSYNPVSVTGDREGFMRNEFGTNRKQKNRNSALLPFYKVTADKAIRNLNLKLMLKLVLGGGFLFIVVVISYLGAIHLYNTSSIRDPCLVANNSLQFLKQMNAHVLSTDTTSGSQESGVPKIIHQQWKDENIPDKFMQWRNKWLKLFPQSQYQYMLWTDTNGRQLIEEHYAWFLPVYDEYDHNINRADAVRYFVLHHYGGIYADLDYEPMMNFYDYLPRNQVAMVESPYYWNEKTQNCLMSSPKNNPFWIDLFKVLEQNKDKTEVLEATGPILLDNAMAYSSHPSYILPCENFQRVPLGEYNQTLWTTVYDREIMFRTKPITKNCGYYSSNQCHFGKHHNTVSYRNIHGLIDNS
mmetsp:Transcript_22231/g.27270  ORF Transcript_22231/g.27270 Transcript_22231/m.27270 type:complete len:389 (+) Transcript_22231:136-1302(+)